MSAGFEVSATVVKTKELDEAYVCREDDKPDFNTGRTTAARYLNLQKYLHNEYFTNNKITIIN